MRHLIWFFLIFLVIFRYWTTRPTYHDGQRLRITGVVSSDPTKNSGREVVNLAGLKISLPIFPEINYGDTIVVEGKVEKGELGSPTLVKFSPSTGIFPTLRKRLVSFYQDSLPEPHSSLVGGVTLGSKASLPPDFWNNLKKTSTAHVVVASGMNVTLVSGFLISFLSVVLPRRKGIFVALAGITIYVFISGFDAPIIRAAIMGTLTFLAQELGRVVSAWRTLFFSGLVMLIVKPEWVTDIGFILSFAATTSLLIFNIKIEKFVTKKAKFLPGFFKSDLSTTVAAQIGVTPILFVTFGQFNILSPIINALVLWTVPFIMILGAFGGGIGLFFPGLGRLILYLAYPLTWWFVFIVRFFG